MASGSRYGARRLFEIRSVLPVISVICDDTKTAVEYFELLKHEVKTRRTVFVFAAPHCGADAAAVIAFAKRKSPQSFEDGDRVFVLIDGDTNPNAEFLRRKARADHIEVAVSQPCYEIWTLAHLQDTGEAFVDCNAVVSRVAAKWKEMFEQEFGRKSKADYRKLMTKRAEAIDRCRRRGPSMSQSWTEVWKVVEAIIAEA